MPRQRQPNVDCADQPTAQATAGIADVATKTSPASPVAPIPWIRSRGFAFALLSLACAVVATSYVAWAIVRDGAGSRSPAAGPIPTTGAEVAGLSFAGESAGTLLFQNVVSGDHWAQVGLVGLDEPDGSRSMLPLRCLRLHFAADRGLCLASDDGFITTYDAYVFGADFSVQHKISLGGIPSRARVSPDGRYGATTVFVSGHSYAAEGFSTETVLIDLASGAKIGNLEEFSVFRDGERIQAADFNFWGVTFAHDSDRFYATLSTRGQTYLVEGDIAARQVRVLRENVECPSLSPDNTKLAFKKRVGGTLGGTVWRFHVLDLTTMTETTLAETRSVDDQIEWLDDSNVLYGVSSDLWTVPADGSGEPRKLMRDALSPAVVPNASPRLPAADPAMDDVAGSPSMDLGVTMSVDRDSVRAGEEVTYTVTVTNNGPADATDVVLDDLFPAGVTFKTLGSAQPANSEYGCPSDRTFVSCTIYRLPSGETWTISFTVQATAAGTIQNRVTVDGRESDPNPDNDSATIQTTITAG